jgi:hypothetical protein
MEQYKIEANEDFFEFINGMLKTGGTYIFPAADQVYIKTEDKFEASQEALDEISPLVSKEFFDKYFKLQQNA